MKFHIPLKPSIQLFTIGSATDWYVSFWFMSGARTASKDVVLCAPWVVANDRICFLLYCHGMTVVSSRFSRSLSGRIRRNTLTKSLDDVGWWLLLLLLLSVVRSFFLERGEVILGGDNMMLIIHLWDRFFWSRSCCLLMVVMMWWCKWISMVQ